MERKNNQLKKYAITGVFVIILISVLWHFLFDLIPGLLTAVFCPVNESVWEHAKLFFLPALIWYIIMYAIAGKGYPNFIFSHAVMLIGMPTAAILLHLFYRIFLPETVMLDILITFTAIALGSFAAYKMTTSKAKLHGRWLCFASLFIIIGIAAVFAVFTFYPPAHPFFIPNT